MKFGEVLDALKAGQSITRARDRRRTWSLVLDDQGRLSCMGGNETFDEGYGGRIVHRGTYGILFRDLVADEPVPDPLRKGASRPRRGASAST